MTRGGRRHSRGSHHPHPSTTPNPKAQNPTFFTTAENRARRVSSIFDATCPEWKGLQQSR